MSGEPFDYYYRWLGIPPNEQPPHLYRLLGLTPFESDPDVIEAAADRQMAHVRTFQSGAHSRESQQALNELSAARILLLNPQRKAAYDEQLRAYLANATGSRQVLMAESLDDEPPSLGIDSDTLAAHHVHLHPARKPTPQNTVFLGSAAMVGLLIVVLAAWMMRPRGSAQVAQPQAQSERQPPTATPAPAAPEPAAKREPTPVPSATGATTPAPIRPTPPAGPLPLDPSVASLPGTGGTITNPKDGSVLVFIPAGKALLGDPPVAIHLPDFYIGQHEVTNAQYKRFVDETGYRPPDRAHFGNPVWHGKEYPPEKAQHPVVCIDWDDAFAYCRWAELRLPSMLEWQKAARGVDGRVYPWGNTPDPRRCCCGRNKRTDDMDPVGSYPEGRSPWGVFDMSGNALEWTADWYEKDVFQRYQTGNLTPPASGSRHAVMGGSRINRSDNAQLRSSNYQDFQLASGMSILGFRVAKSLGAPVAASTDMPSGTAVPTDRPPESPALAGPPPKPVVKPAAPDAAAQEQAEKEIRATHQEEFERADKSEVARQKLAAALVIEAAAPDVELAKRFKSLRLAYDLAGMVFDAATVFAAVDALNAAFQIDPLAPKLTYSESAVKQELDDEQRKLLGAKLADTVEQALTLEQFDTADRTLKLARRALHGLDRKTVERFDALAQQIKSDRKEFDAVTQARQQLRAQPADPPANALVGWWVFEHQEDGSAGLAHLARGDDDPAKALAARDLAASAPLATDALALGDAWWDFGNNSSAARAKAVRRRAEYWYHRALPGLPDGAERDRAAERTKNAVPTVGATPAADRGLTQ